MRLSRIRHLVLALTLLALAGCSGLGSTPQVLPTVVLGSTNAAPQANASPQATQAGAGESSGIVASGIVVPAQEMHLSFTVVQAVKTVNVKVGDTVKAGQVLATLDDGSLQAQIQQAQAALTAAQANYDLLKAGPTDYQLRQAEDAVVEATANYSRTVEGPRPSAVAAAQAAANAALDAYNKVKAGPQPADFAAARAAYNNAQAVLAQAQGAYDAAYKQNPPGIGASPQALALQQATNN